MAIADAHETHRHEPVLAAICRLRGDAVVRPRARLAALDLMASRGLIDVVQHPLTFGIASLYVGTKPPFAEHADGR